jgi:hypothetical protein
VLADIIGFRPHAAGATKRLGAGKNFLFQLFNCYLILHCRTKRKQALLRSNLPGIYPVADEVIRRFQVWFIQTFFVQLLLKPACLKKPFRFYATTPVTYSFLFFNTKLILDNKCLATRIIALFFSIRLQYSLYFISKAGSLRTTAQLLSTKAVRK